MDAAQRPGLRERKKAKTRAAIQHEALRLFRRQGYEATTIEQIAEAAEVSPSTLFRYFGSKEELVFNDEYDPLFLEACRAQPRELGPVEAVRRGLSSVFGTVSREELSDMRERAELALSVPELRAAMLDQLVQGVGTLAALVADRGGGPEGSEAKDFALGTVTGAIGGVLIAAELYWVEHPETDLPQLLDAALAQLAAGLPL